MTKPTVAVIDDHAGFRRAVRAVVAAAGATVEVEADSVPSARRLVDHISGCELVLMDVNLGDGSGLDLTRELVAGTPGLRVVLVSSLSASDLPADANDCGAVDFVEKARLTPETIAALTRVPPEPELSHPHPPAI